MAVLQERVEHVWQDSPIDMVPAGGRGRCCDNRGAEPTGLDADGTDSDRYDFVGEHVFSSDYRCESKPPGFDDLHAG